MRRLIAVAAAVLVLAPSAQAKTWNAPEQEAVADAGVLPRLADGHFHGERNLTAAQLSAALGETATASTATVSVTAFDARLVEHLGLTDVAQHVQTAARQLNPPRSFGTEVVSRFLGLRTNHPAVDDAIELYPSDPITRAEAAHSFAVLPGDTAWARAQLLSFELPSYDARTAKALRTAVSKIGMPYIWGGETDTASSYYGYQAHGGYDCSGFVWRVFKLTNLVQNISGRTAAQMAGEIPKARRIRLDDLQPGDLIFFGDARFNVKATEANTTHVGIALSPHWMVHSSAQGVYVSSLDDEWRRDRFTWARRVL
jgi:cell wall-associated NlpC family hydrolase